MDDARHGAIVRSIQEQVRRFAITGRKIRIYHGSTNSTRPQNFEHDTVVDVSALNRVLFVDTDARCAWVEPNVPMDALVDATLAHGLVPPVVMEFPGITVGGGVQGGAAESSSFRYGLFHDTCDEYQMVLGDGSVITASRESHPDLFWGTAGSYGSLGVVTRVKLRLVPAQPFVRLSYRSVSGFAEAVTAVREATEGPSAFVDAILFSRTRGVVMTGTLSDATDLPMAQFHRARDEWFYLHAQTVAQQHTQFTELVPLRDYLFRYDRGAFWMGRVGFHLLHLPFRRTLRVLFHRLFTTRTLYRVLHATNRSQRYLVQDLSLPERSVVPFLEYVDSRLGIYPLWLCPLRPGREDRLSPACLPTDRVVNVGVWGEVGADPDRFVVVNRELEQRVKSLGGRKVLYAHAYYPREEFWQIYDPRWYQALREHYHATAFPDLFEKTHVSDRLRPSLVGALWSLVRSPFRLPLR